MKNKITALILVAVTAIALAPKPAKAGDKELALVGGLIGGLIIGSAINDNHHSTGYRHRDTTVIVNGRRNYDDRYDRRDHYDRHDRGNAGYWKHVTIKVWVPGCWVVERSHGCDYRRYVDGYYTYRTDRVWVSYDRHDRRDRYDPDDCDDRRSDYGRGR